MSSSEDSALGSIGLGEMIESLRKELESARVKGRGSSISFEVEKVSLELKVGVSRTLKADGGVKFWVLNSTVASERDTQRLHTFTLTLNPQDAASKSRVKVSSEEAPVNLTR